MKKVVSIFLICILVLGSVSALAAKEKAAKPNTYSMPTDGTVLQDSADRNISPKTDLSRNPVISGESPITGLPLADGLYMPMIIQISNPDSGSVTFNGQKVNSAGLGNRAPWSGQYADIVYEGILYRSGQTRISFLFSDSFAEGLPTSAGPVRSARIGHVLLREEWQGGIAFAGGPKVEESNISAKFTELGVTEKGLAFNLLDNSNTDYKNRVKGVTSAEALNCNPAGLRSTIPATTVAIPHPFLFSDESPYTEGYEFAYNINLDWGHKKYISHFYYDEVNNLYLRYSGSAPYLTFADAEDRSNENQQQLSFSNVIIQRITYDYVNNSKIMPIMNSVGKGNADIFIGGRYIPGYWVRTSETEPTIFFDNQGNELHLTRGKTFIAHFPPESLLTYQGMQ